LPTPCITASQHAQGWLSSAEADSAVLYAAHAGHDRLHSSCIPCWLLVERCVCKPYLMVIGLRQTRCRHELQAEITTNQSSAICAMAGYIFLGEEQTWLDILF
jgi:hypothetical protein